MNYKLSISESVAVVVALVIVFWMFFAPLTIFADHNVNINTAGVSELETLDGIGEVKAQAIIDYRNANGPFQKVEDIKNVSGIGDATFDKIKDHITVGSGGSNPDPDPDPDTEPEEENEESEDQNEEEAETSTKSNGGDGPTYPLGGEILTVKINANKTHAIVHTPITFTGIAYYGNRESVSADVMWNFGNGDTAKGKEVTYTFDYVGTYVVTFSADMLEESTYKSMTIDVVASGVHISSIQEGPDGFIELENSSEKTYDLTGWKIVSGGRTFAIPKHTFINKGAKLKFSAQTLYMPPVKNRTALFYPDGSVVHVFAETPIASIVAKPQDVVGTKVNTVQKPVVEVLTQDNEPEIASNELAALGATKDTNSIMTWLLLLVGLITIGSITVLLIPRSKMATNKEEEDEYDPESYTFKD